MAVAPDRTRRTLRHVCLGSAATGASALVTLFVLQDGSFDAPWLALAFLAALTSTQLFPLHLTHTGESEDLRLEEAFFVPMVVLLSGFEAVAVIGLAMGIADVVLGRPWLKTCFNVGMIVTSSAVGVAVARGLGLSGDGSFRDIVAATIGGLVLCAVSAVAVSGVVTLAQGANLRRVLFDGAVVRVATWLGSLSLGVLVLVAAIEQPFALAVALVPVAVLQFAYVGALRQWRQRQQAQQLYDAAGRIRAGVESGAVRRETVEAARSLLAAGSVRLVDAGQPSPQGAMRVALDGDTVLEVDGRASGGAWTSVERGVAQALAAVASSALSNALMYEQLQAITRSLGEGVLSLDGSGEITFVNPAAARLLGWRPDELVGRHIAAAIDPAGLLTRSDGALEWVHLPRLRAGETLRIDEYAVTRSDGTALDVALTASPVLRGEEVVGGVIALRDVTERKALENRLMHQAFHDQLTGLPNRALFLDRLEQARLRAHDDATMQAVLFIDLDRFKVINDSLGHRIGDDVLCTVASRLVGALGPHDTAARFGGDEFTVLLDDLRSREDAAAAAERIMRALQPPVIAGDRRVVLSVSIGIAVAEPGNAPSDLLAAADIAMYEAKSAGKNRYAIAAADADDVALARLDLEMELRAAISNGELELHYQPVTRTDGGGVYGVEALVRWRHPTLGLLPPSHFMDLAEDTGLVHPLGDWVLQAACEAAQLLNRRHPSRPLVMAVNLSSRQFEHPDLCDRVAAVLASTGLDPSLLTLEITETVVMRDTEVTLMTLRALKRLGVRLSIDDFGTGYSSLSYLKRFPVDTVKIDKSFVDGLASNPVDREIVAAVVRLATAVGMQTVAEGVETTAQLEQLRLLGCGLVQGYLLSRPQPRDELDALLRGPAATLPAPRRPSGREVFLPS